MQVVVSIDRFEGDKAVLFIDEIQVVWPKAFLPQSAREGDILAIDIQVDVAQTAKTKAEVAALLAELQN